MGKVLYYDIGCKDGYTVDNLDKMLCHKALIDLSPNIVKPNAFVQGLLEDSSREFISLRDYLIAGGLHFNIQPSIALEDMTDIELTHYVDIIIYLYNGLSYS